MATSKRLSTGRGLETIKEQKKRPYYHSSTNLPVENTEEQYDSDEFVEMSFLTSEIEKVRKGCTIEIVVLTCFTENLVLKRLDEFTIALSESERNLLKMWNRHVMADRPLAIAHYKNSLLRFIKVLSEEQLRSKFWLS